MPGKKESPDLESISPEADSEEIMRCLEQEGILPPGLSATAATAAVMCVLARRLSGGEARRLVESMPRFLRPILRPCADHPEPREIFGRGELVDQVGEHLRLDREAAANISRAVFAAVRKQLPPGEVNRVLSQLPGGLRELWGPPQPDLTAGIAHADTASEAILRRVEIQEVLPHGITAAEAVGAVMCILAQRLSGGQARKLLATMPPVLGAMLQPCSLHFGRAEVFDRPGFFRRVSEHLKVGYREAEQITAAVMAAVKPGFSQEEIDQAASQLPVDLRDLWIVSIVHSPGGKAAPGLSGPDFIAEAIARELEESGVLPSRVTTTEAVSSVMCVLAQRLSGGEARHMLDKLPPSLRAMLFACALHPEPAEPFHREEFIARVARHLNVDHRAAEEITRAVFRAVKKQLPAKEIRDVLSQLPGDLEDMWQAEEERIIS